MREEAPVAKQKEKSTLNADEAEQLIKYAEKEGAREELIGKIIFTVMGVGFAVLIALKLMHKI
jgi:hypothetical protein